jgi:ATP-dependent Lon protease
MARSPETLDLPVLPLRDVVVFPHMVIPLFVGRDKSIRRSNRQWSGQAHPAAGPEVGRDRRPACGRPLPGRYAGQVLQMLKLPDGTVKVLVEGLSRVQVTHVDERNGSLHGQAVEIDATDEREAREVEAIAAR